MTTTQASPDVGREQTCGTASGSAIALHDVRKAFGPVHAVNGVDLDVDRGEVVAFLGPNGAGKTTTIDMVLGLSAADTGTVEVFGGDPRRAIAEGRISAVMQTGGLLKDLTVRETLEFTACLHVDTQPVDDVLTSAGIDHIADQKVGKCSGGEQQRLRFAMALLPNPDLLILDEPTTGMDVTGRRDFWNAIRADAAKGRTILFATHYLEEADQYADRIVLMSRGRIVADGNSAQVKAMASGRTVRATVSDLSAEVLAGIPAADGVDRLGDQVVVHTKDSDAVARYLFAHTDAHDMEITAKALEDAFIALTGDGTDNGSPSANTSRTEQQGAWA